MKTKLRLSIQLKLFRNGQMILCTSRLIKDRILAAAQVEMWDKAYLRVTYSNEYGLYNDGYYESFNELKQALSIFTERSLLNHVGGINE